MYPFQKIVCYSLLFLCLSNLNAQERSNRRFVIETGYLLSSSDAEGLGLLFGVEPKVKVFENTFAGAKFGFAMNTNTYDNFAELEYELDTEYDNAIMFLSPTLDYYFDDVDWKEHSLSPYLGAGLGYYLLYDVGVHVFGTNDTFEVDMANRLGFLLRGGFEISSWRFGIEYTFLPKADIEIPDDRVIGTVDNRYGGLTIAYILGAIHDAN